MAYGTVEAEKWADEMGLLIFECTSSLGRGFTAYIGGAQHVYDLERWTIDGGEPGWLARERLEAAQHIVALLTPALSSEQVVAWFRDPCPELEGISPATALHRTTTSAIRPRLTELALRHASATGRMPVG